ncbi:MAG TPA: CARDB domain-containing protein [Gaiellaceae bacterium]|nr:CARDB domain-containing protein [Gaiellaceae bacterium]
MVKLRILQAGLVALAVAAGFPASGTATGGLGVPAQAVEVTKETSTMSIADSTTDYGKLASAVDDRVGTTEWRVVKDTGNCCENHLGVSRDGRLFDVGGSFINYTDDRGLTWKSVQPLNPLVNGEGSMAMAPNGDVIGMTWDAYSGDHFVAYKYDTVAGKWFTLDNPIHEPFYDRPWLTVIPGPFAIGLGADTVPYVAVVQGGTGVKDPMLMTTDGLSYTEISSPFLDGQNDNPLTAWFPTVADPMNDWIQPIRSAPATPLGPQHALTTSSNAGGVYLMDSADRTWDAWTLPGGAPPPTYIQVDSAGRIHNVRSAGANQLEYRISSDGGQTWTSATYPLPFGGLTDFKVNKSVGIGAIALRLNNQDWVYKFDISGDTAQLMRRYRVGLGDNPAGSSVGALTNPRMDFQNVVILPDGHVATSFLDSTTLSHPPGTGALGRIGPALAIELDTTLPPVKPDLTVSAPTVSAKRAKGGDSVTFAVKVANGGEASAPNVAVRFLVDGVAVGSDRTIAQVAGGSTSSAVSSDAWSAAKKNGTHVVEAVVDPANTVAELDEDNNSASLSFKVRNNRIVK